MAATPLQVQQRGVDVGVALVLQTSDDRVLLTRRAKELRIFPNVWVPPGLTSRPGKHSACVSSAVAGSRSVAGSHTPLLSVSGGHVEPDETVKNCLGYSPSKAAFTLTYCVCVYVCVAAGCRSSGVTGGNWAGTRSGESVSKDAGTVGGER